MTLSGKHVVVTGASRGVGATVALAMGRHGAKVTLTSRVAEQSGDDVKAKIIEGGGTASYLVADVTDPGPAKWLISTADAPMPPRKGWQHGAEAYAFAVLLAPIRVAAVVTTGATDERIADAFIPMATSPSITGQALLAAPLSAGTITRNQ